MLCDLSAFEVQRPWIKHKSFERGKRKENIWYIYKHGGLALGREEEGASISGTVTSCNRYLQAQIQSSFSTSLHSSSTPLSLIIPLLPMEMLTRGNYQVTSYVFLNPFSPYLTPSAILISRLSFLADPIAIRDLASGTAQVLPAPK